MGIEANSETETRTPWRAGRWICLAALRGWRKMAAEMRMLVALLIGAGGGVEKRPVPPYAKNRANKNRRSPKRQVASPLSEYVVKSEAPSAKKPERDIVITRPGEKREVLRFPFQRQVDVVWAPDESGVAVVDLVLQNETRVVIFALPTGQPLYELRREHVCQLNPQLPCGESYTHVYFSNVVWLAPDRIEVTVDMVNPLEPNLPARIHSTLTVSFPH